MVATGPTTPGWLRNLIVLTVLGLWVTGFIVTIVNDEFDIPPAVHTGALMTIGAVFGISFYKGDK